MAVLLMKRAATKARDGGDGEHVNSEISKSIRPSATEGTPF